MPTTAAFVRALTALPPLSSRMQELLRTHAKSPNYVSDARHLAKAAGYKSWRGMNLQYGLLGKRIAQELGEKEENLSLLAEFVSPKALSNKEWLVLMKPAFAKAVTKASWFKSSL